MRSIVQRSTIGGVSRLVVRHQGVSPLSAKRGELLFRLWCILSELNHFGSFLQSQRHALLSSSMEYQLPFVFSVQALRSKSQLMYAIVLLVLDAGAATSM